MWLHVIAALPALLCFGAASLGERPPERPRDLSIASGSSVQQHTERVLKRFSTRGYGQDITSPLTPDSHGNLFGTTEVGGLRFGTVYELSPNGQGGWTYTLVYAFKGGSDGGFPQFTPLIFDKSGNLYGTTGDGGANGFGVVFKLHHAGRGWVESALYSFLSFSGVYPFNSLIMDAAGNLYGTDNLYHDGGGITEAVYELKPSNGVWLASIVYDIGMPAANGGGGGLVMDGAGHIFGISSGAFKPAIVFELTQNGSGSWSATTLYTFATVKLFPTGAPVLDKQGNIYGTTLGGGANRNGTVLKLIPGKSGPWQLKTLYAFKGGTSDGASPYAAVTFDAAGDIFGTTTFGGPSNAGTVYELVPSGARYDEQQLWTFDGKDGMNSESSVALDSAGDIFGTTTAGGGNHQCYAKMGCGNAFEITNSR